MSESRDTADEMRELLAALREDVITDAQAERLVELLRGDRRCPADLHPLHGHGGESSRQPGRLTFAASPFSGGRGSGVRY